MVVGMYSYLAKQGDTYFFRRRVPQQFIHRIGTREIYRSLATTSVRIAKQRLLYLFHGTEKLFAMARLPEVTDEQLASAAAWFLESRGYKKSLEGMEPERLRNLPPPNIIQDEVDRYLEANELPVGNDEQRAQTRRDVFHQVIDAFLFRTGFAPDDEFYDRSKTGIHPQRIVQAVNREAERAVRERLKEYTHYREGDKELPRAAANKKFSEMIETFIDWRQGRVRAGAPKCERAKWTSQTEHQNRATFGLFVIMMNDPSLSTVNPSMVYKFRQQLATLPRSHGKNNGKVKIKRTVSEEIERKEKNGIASIKTKTLKRHFSALSQYFRYLQLEGIVGDNPFTSQQFRIEPMKRDTWTDVMLLELFQSAEYLTHPKQSANHWIPLIALFTGLRLEEIARIRPQHDIEFAKVTDSLTGKSDLTILKVTPHNGWNPKTAAAKREIPVHTWLIDHGFNQLVDRRSEEIENANNQEQSIYLFPELHANGKNGTLTARFSREFSRLKKRLELSMLKRKLSCPKNLTFHSFRHTFRSQLAAQKIPDSMIDALLGHEDGQHTVQKAYTVYDVVDLDEIVELFELPRPPKRVPFKFRGSAVPNGTKPAYLDFLHTKFPEPENMPSIVSEPGEDVANADDGRYVSAK
jgi:integrase